MEQKNPIYSEETRCRDCYRCIRECPVKAIRVVDGEAEVVPDRCILCGRCVEVCPVGAKKIRDDLRRVLHLLKRKSRVILSLAPSFAGEFRGILPEQIVSAAKVLGFFGVSETALGAEEVSAALRQNLSAENKPMVISTACPSAVELVRKYYPEFTQNLSELHSPLLSHCVMLKQIYDSDIGIVFAGPCVAKKKEADQFPDLLDIAITFNDLKQWFNSSCIDLRLQVTDENDVFIPRNSENGSLYPIEGGMISTLSGKDFGYRYMTLSGISTIQRAFDEMSGHGGEGALFLELLACENGCIGGPGCSSSTSIGSRLAVLNYAESKKGEPDGLYSSGISHSYSPELISPGEISGDLITEALCSIGKFTEEEELNCDSCGYGTCKNFARALLTGQAEPCMCSSYMRQLAQKKANALIKTIPYGVVIVDSSLQIIDSNDHFTEMLGEEAASLARLIPGLIGADISRVVPFYRLFKNVLESGEDITQQFVKHRDNVMAVTVFTVERSRIAGAIIRDATLSESKREQIIGKAREVIRNTSVTAQQIAFLMGKNAAQSEKILNSLIESFSAEEDGNGPGNA